jgi:hypothetical protein
MIWRHDRRMLLGFVSRMPAMSPAGTEMCFQPCGPMYGAARPQRSPATPVPHSGGGRPAVGEGDARIPDQPAVARQHRGSGRWPAGATAIPLTQGTGRSARADPTGPRVTSVSQTASSSPATTPGGSVRLRHRGCPGVRLGDPRARLGRGDREAVTWCACQSARSVSP